jgi:hypothetical protein
MSVKPTTKTGSGDTLPLQNNTAAELFTDESASRYVGGVLPRTIRDWRTRRGLPYLRLTSKVIRIRREDLDRWLARHQVAITRAA